VVQTVTVSGTRPASCRPSARRLESPLARPSWNGLFQSRRRAGESLRDRLKRYAQQCPRVRALPRRDDRPKHLTHKYSVVYPEYGADPLHPFGPVATPVVATGRFTPSDECPHLLCLDALTGRVLWSHDLQKEFNTTEDLRGFNSSPSLKAISSSCHRQKSADFHHSLRQGTRAAKSGKDSTKFHRTHRPSSSTSRGGNN
jgi:hypothetical protein